MAHQVAYDVAYQVAQSNGPFVAQSGTSRGDKSGTSQLLVQRLHPWVESWVESQMPDAGAERKAQMTEKDKLTLRKPLAPKADDAECKAAKK